MKKINLGMILTANNNEIKLCEDNEVPIGILDSYITKEWRVKINIFHFKFKWKGKAINFCIKYNIPFKKLYFYGLARIIQF